MNTKKLLITILAGLTLVYSAPNIAKAADAEEKEGGKVYMVKSFSDLDKQYIKAGKTPQIKSELEFLLDGLSKQGYKGNVNDLIDGKNENNEFRGLYIDETDPFNQATLVMYTDKNKELKSISREGMGCSNRMFLDMEIKGMNRNIENGLKTQEIYQKFNSDELKERMTKNLDAQAGKIKGVSFECTPRYENQMSFITEDEFRNILSKTKSISINYEPHDSISALNGQDFKVAYDLNDGKKVVKYVDKLPLSFLEDKANEEK